MRQGGNHRELRKVFPTLCDLAYSLSPGITLQQSSLRVNRVGFKETIFSLSIHDDRARTKWAEAPKNRDLLTKRKGKKIFKGNNSLLGVALIIKTPNENHHPILKKREVEGLSPSLPHGRTCIRLIGIYRFGCREPFPRLLSRCFTKFATGNKISLYVP